MELLPIGPSIWLAEGGIVDFFGFAYPTRSVVVRLKSGDLWVWSPIALAPGLKAEIDTLGRVGHLVSPNKLHHLHLREWTDGYPEAELWGPASTLRKRQDLEFQPALTDSPPSVWEDDIDQAWFRGSIVFDEIVFFHHLSKTAIIADLSENFGDAFLNTHWAWWQRLLAGAWKITADYGYPPLELRLSWIDRKPARAALRKLIAWKPERVVMAHGEWRRTGGQAYVERAFSWLGPT